MTICILCGNTERFEQFADRVRDSEQYSVVRCGVCGHVQISSLPSDEEEKEFYNVNQPAKSLNVPTDVDYLRKLQAYDTERRVKLITDCFQTDSRILEIGSGRGFFLGALFELGYDITGIEISQEMRAIAQQVSKAPILNVNLLESTLDIGVFDVIAAFHLIEHFANPVEFCKIVKQYLSSSGVLLLELPNLDDLMVEVCSTYREFWLQRAHISYFNARTIHRVLEEAGYSVEVTGIQRYGIDNMVVWRMNGKPQLDVPSYETINSYRWLECYYKSQLEKNLKCDTLLVTAKPRGSYDNKSSRDRDKS